MIKYGVISMHATVYIRFFIFYNIYMAKLDEKLIEQFSEEIKDGLPFTYACDLFEISFVTAQNWMKQGEADREAERETLSARFFKSIKKAYACYIKETKKTIRKGEAGWQGQAWWLERTNKMFVLNNENEASIEPVVVNPNVRTNK